ncbi:MAG: phospholipase D family protein [Gammaproteobacteria bacterium]
MVPRARLSTLLVFILVLAGCATLPDHLPKGPEGKAIPPQPIGILADLEDGLRPRLGSDRSAWQLLDSNEDALRWRLALVDSAQHSLDLQYYFWWEDDAGQLLMKHIVDAADRGVKVRIILDDLTTLLKDDRTLEVRDWNESTLNAHANIKLRLFNAFHSRTLLGRGVDFLRRMEIMNQRMHNKLLVADNRAVVLGGRNVGNEYFGFGKDFNFRDLDVLGTGEVARQTSAVFDRFWNSTWVVPVSALKLGATARDLRADKPAMLRSLEGSPVLEHFPLERKDWEPEIADFAKNAHAGGSRVLTDVPSRDVVRHRMPKAMRDLMTGARSELLITNAYVIPDDSDIAMYRELRARGVTVKVLTNSLASQDVPAVNSHYKQWRKQLLQAGIELYESRPDAAIAPTLADTPPVHAAYMGLHVKAVVVDRKRVFVGSMNLDPRSAELNSEMGVVIESEPLAGQLAGIMERDMQPANAWRVTLNEHGSLRWTADGEPLKRQPARGLWQRTQDVFFMLFPRNLY